VRLFRRRRRRRRRRGHILLLRSLSSVCFLCGVFPFFLFIKKRVLWIEKKGQSCARRRRLRRLRPHRTLVPASYKPREREWLQPPLRLLRPRLGLVVARTRCAQRHARFRNRFSRRGKRSNNTNINTNNTAGEKKREAAAAWYRRRRQRRWENSPRWSSRI